MAVFVGCDLGTMGTKAAVVDSDGRILGDAFEEVPLHTPRPGVVEQSLEEIEGSAHRTIAEALSRAGNPERVDGVAFSGQMSGVGTIDTEFRPATHFDSWLDSRSAPYIREMGDEARRVTELSGCPPTYSHGPKIMWWQREHPDEFSRIARFVVPTAYVAGRLCGLSADEAFIDRTHLHFTNLTDTAAASWSDELIERFGIDRRVLPRIVDPVDVVGSVTAEMAEVTGLPAGTPLAAGAGDQTAASLGAGVADPGQAFDSAGTASVLAVCLDRFAPDVDNQVFMATHSVIPDVFLGLAFINGGGLALRWFRDVVARLDDRSDAYPRLDEQAAEVEPGSGGLVWLPHFQGRVLPPDPSARAGWVGLTAGHDHGHLFRSILEGIAYEYAEWVRVMTDLSGQQLTHSRVLGGGARSRLWNQIKADVMGVNWLPTQREECGVLGDALIAAVATGHIDIGDLAETARRWQRTSEPFQPDPERHKSYGRYLEVYRRLQEGVTPAFSLLDA